MDKFYFRFIKRSLDITISTVILAIASPILLLSIVTMIILNKSFSVFFVQLRPGLNEKPFKLIKLKTMNDNVNDSGELLPDYVRTTFIGKLFRKFSIDELPQLINVIKGDMSLIGPRPLLVEYLSYYTPEQRRRHHVLPGITGWAQIHGRNNLEFNERFKLDVWYVENVSFLLDCKIFLSTVIKIFKSENVLIQDPNKFSNQNL